MIFETAQRAITRRRALLLGTASAAGAWLAHSISAIASDPLKTPPGMTEGCRRVENILQLQGNMTHGLLHFGIDRGDISGVTLRGIPILPSFQINGDIYFQPLGNGRSIVNADFPLRPEELNRFIDQLVAHNIVFQAQHQHMYDFLPMVWFVHFRAAGSTEEIARGIKAALSVTSTPFPQKPRANPQTPLPKDELGRILGAPPDVGADGVVSFNVPRAETITLGGIRVNPYLNIAAPIAFQPYPGAGGTKAAAVADFAMTASEVNNVMKVMRAQGWDIGCLYNQETDEHPQLYFSHQFKTGEARQLAREIRAGLEQTNSKMA